MDLRAVPIVGGDGMEKQVRNKGSKYNDHPSFPLILNPRN